MDKMNTILSERFELLSAYLDNEASPEERIQVETWLAEDPEFKKLYRQMTSLHYSFREIPAVEPSTSTDALVDAVMARVDRRSRLWRASGIGAVAAALVAGLTSLIVGNSPWSPQMANSLDDNQDIAVNVPAKSDDDSRTLMLALDQPPVEIPVVGESSGSMGISDSPHLKAN
jgi:anti-sigma factor RsiW